VHARHEGVVVDKKFAIKIEPRLFGLPQLREIGGLTESVRRRGISTHVFESGVACLGTPHECHEALGARWTLRQFVEVLVIPYLFALSIAAETGSWPWGERSHGLLGILEFFGEVGTTDDAIARSVERDTELRTFLATARWPDECCPCGSREPFSTCHRLARRGLARLIRLRDVTDAVNAATRSTT